LRLRQALPALAGEGDLGAMPGGGLAALVDRIPLVGAREEPLRMELGNFRDACLGRGEPVVTGRDGREALAVTLSIEERIRAHVAHSHPS
jgi:hypothetical protein